MENTDKTNSKNLAIYTILFSIMLAIGFLPIYLQGRSLIWEIDGIGQYYPAFLYIGKFIRAFLTTGAIPSYDLSIAMGENIVGCLNYYGFGDPINLFAVFATNTNGHIVFAITFFLRLYLAGLSMMYYLKTINVGKHSRVIASLGYCFTGFTLFGCMYYIEWLSALILLPLMLATAERYITHKDKTILFSLSVCYGALCGFYYLYMTSLALAIYCITRVIAIDGKIEIKKLIKTCFSLLLWYLIGLGLALPILLQALDAFLSSERNSQALSAITNISNYIPSIRTLLRFVKYSMVPMRSHYELGITIFHWLAVFFVIIKALTKREKKHIQLGVGILLTIIAVALPITGYIFNGFGEKNTRWFYIVNFIATVILAVEIDDIFNKKARKIYTYCCILLVLNITANIFMVYSDKGLNLSNELIPTNDVSNYIASPVGYFNEINDGEVYRIDHDLYTDINGRPDNIAMLNEYNSFSYWFSIINSNSQNYVDWDAGKKLNWRSYGFGEHAYTSALAGSKYYLRKGDSYLGDNFTFLEEINFNGEKWSLYKNNLYKGIVYECNWNEEYSSDLNGDFEEYNKKLYESIDESHISNLSYDSKSNELSFEAAIDKDKSYVAVAIPYNWAWKATIDGKDAEISKFNCMMMLLVNQGEHVVKLTYTPIIRNIGIGVSLVSLIILLLLHRRKKGQGRQ